MIKIGNVKYLPSVNLALTPFGSEFYLNNYFKCNHHTFKIYARYGDPKFENFWGAGASALNLFQNKCLYLNASSDMWSQPSLTLQSGNYSSRVTGKGFGGCVSATIGIKILNNKFNIVAQTGYKTDGFLQGENLSKGFFIGAGIGFINL